MPAPSVAFVRDGVVVSSGHQGRELPGGRRLLSEPWIPGSEISIAGQPFVAPQRAECLPLYSIPLGDVSRLTSMDGAAPNTALQFSPSGDRLAIGSHLGEVLIVDAWSGRVLVRKTLAETMVKALEWSEDGSVLYAAEQSPDAFLHALDATTLGRSWSLRLADFVESSVPPDADDIYGVYSLPAAYGLQRLPGGELLTVALHSWRDADGVHQNRSQLLRVNGEGEITNRWPAEPAHATFMHPRVDPTGTRLVISVNHSADGEPPADLPVGGAMVLELETFLPVFSTVPEALEPWFQGVSIWEALDVSASGIFMGLDDGRVAVTDLEGNSVLALSSGAPVMAGETPIHASVGWGFFADKQVIYSTSTTRIPYGSTTSALRPPTTHPGENTVWATDLSGVVQWSWRGSQNIEGMTRAADGNAMVVGAGARTADERRDLYGGLIFDLEHPDDGRSGEDRLTAFCPTEGPIFFRQAISHEGLVALSEHPYLDEENVVHGSYRVTVMR